MRQIYAAAVPFIVLEVLALALFVAFPALALWLPSMIGR
jgi:TRAP-type mannitol/chloroaromatic compound transport system permease large subunit